MIVEKEKEHHQPAEPDSLILRHLYYNGYHHQPLSVIIIISSTIINHHHLFEFFFHLYSNYPFFTFQTYTLQAKFITSAQKYKFRNMRYADNNACSLNFLFFSLNSDENICIFTINFLKFHVAATFLHKLPFCLPQQRLIQIKPETSH